MIRYTLLEGPPVDLSEGVQMKHEIVQRIEAIRRKLAREPVSTICRAVGRSRPWFYRWWGRYQQDGSAGLADRSHRPKNPAGHISSALEQAILAIRQRLWKQRYATRGAPSIARELEFLGYERVSVRTIYNVLKRHGLTVDRQKVRPKPALRLYPLPKITRSGQWQQIDLIGPRFLRGSGRKIYFLVLRDLYDQAVYVEVATSRSAHTMLGFLLRGWQALGLPDHLSLDNAAEFSGSLRHRRTFSQVVRLCLLLGVEPVFIPQGEACRHGGIENFNGLFDRLFYRPVRLRSLAHIRQELARLRHMANHQHPHQRLGYLTSAEVRQGQSLRQLPNHFTLPEKLPLAAGRVSFIRRVRRSGRIIILNEKFFVGRRLRGQYVWATIFTRTQQLKIYSHGRLIKTFDYRLPTT